MSDQPVPIVKAREFAVACQADDAEAYYRPFEFTQEDLPFLEDGEYVLVEFRRRRRKPEYEVVLDEEHVMDVAI